MSEQNPADPETNVSSAFPFSLQYVKILGAEMAYLDTDDPSGKASGLTAVFIHGNPTSSYLWRNIIPHVSDQVRCVASDLVGMGASSKPDIKYKYMEHANYLDNFLDVIVPNGKIVLLIQDWGSALGFDCAFRHQNRVAGLAFMEFILGSHF